jgi:Skp family chaperone for outer membrane proteins
MRKGIVALFLAACFLVCTGRVFAAEKLAYVDLSRLFDEYGKTKDYDKVLEDKQKAYESEREKKVSEVKQLQDKMSLLNDKEKEAKKSELEDKLKALQEYDRTKQTDLRKERDEKMKEILKDIEKAVTEHAKGNGYTMVFNDRVLVYQEKNLDITEPVLKILQGYYKK